MVVKRRVHEGDDDAARETPWGQHSAEYQASWPLPVRKMPARRAGKAGGQAAPRNLSVGMASAVFEQTCVLCLRGGGEGHESGCRSINLFACMSHLVGAIWERSCRACAWLGGLVRQCVHDDRARCWFEVSHHRHRPRSITRPAFLRGPFLVTTEDGTAAQPTGNLHHVRSIVWQQVPPISCGVWPAAPKIKKM